ncbi:MAG: hypothetical protein EBU80_07085 [Chitinophagia bacterium]|nr:hypothetical protein [Chitinophagia bacterium]
MIKKLLQQLAIIIQVGRTFFPSILLLTIAYAFFKDFVQGKDIILTGLQSRQTSFFFLVGLLFWVLITWYTSRLIAYNHDRLYLIAKKGLYHTPRILGYLCFTVILLSFTALYPAFDNFYIHIGILVLNLIVYGVLQHFFEIIKNRKRRELLIRFRIITWVAFILIIAVMVVVNKLQTYIYLLPVLQTGYLYLVITRRKISESSTKHSKIPSWWALTTSRDKYRRFITWIFTDPASRKEPVQNDVVIQTEKNIFSLFLLFSVSALIIYLNAVLNIHFARFISPLPIILLSFGVLLGAGNILSLLSTKLQINFHFLFIAGLIITGYFVETHGVAIHRKSSPFIDYSKRTTLRNKFVQWLDTKGNEWRDSSNNTLPVYFVIADGGASRSAYWTASVLSTLETETNGNFSKHLFCLSGASGGSFGNMVFYGSLYGINENRTEKIQSYLSSDFLSFPLARLLGPDLVIPFIPGVRSGDRARALEISMENTGKKDSLSRFMRKDISEIVFSNNRDFNPIIAINATRMQDGAPGVISNILLENEVSGKRIDILGLLEKDESIHISTAVVLGARFPYFSPAGRIKDQYFVDGGYFDNSGSGIVHEMILDLQQMITDTLKTNPLHPFKKIRFHVVHISNQTEKKDQLRKIHPLVNDLAAPIKTIMGSYASQTDFNNLRLNKYLMELYKGDTTFRIINLYKKDEANYFPMNWSISDSSLKKMNQRLINNVEIKAMIHELSTH